MAALTAYNAGFDTGSREYATAVMCAATEIMEMSKKQKIDLLKPYISGVHFHRYMLDRIL